MNVPIPVVAGIIEQDGLLLIALRPPEKILGLKWEFPGGKVEKGEDPAAALVRELREELGCETEVCGALSSFIHNYGDYSIHMMPMRVRLLPESKRPHPHEHVEIKWVPLHSLRSFEMPAADLPIVAELLAQ